MTKRAHLGERIGVDHAIAPGEIIGAIDVGSNAARMKLARVLSDGSFERLHQQRDPIQPGEGLWETGEMSADVVDRLVRTMRAYRKICEREGAGHVRAAATSALREARNREAVVARVRDEARVELEVVSGTEEARLIALGVLRGMPRTASSLLQVDELYHRALPELFRLMARSPEALQSGLHCQAVAKHLERIGDHATNIAEEVVYMVEATDIRHAGKRAKP